MLNLRRFTNLVLLLVIMLSVVATAAGQDADALLRQGVALYKNRNFKLAKETLEKVDPDAISEGSRRTLTVYLEKAGPAIEKQAEAAQAYKAAKEALKAGNYAEAETGFEKAVLSDYLHKQQQKDAEAQLALARAKKAAAVEETPEIKVPVEATAAEKAAADKAAAEKVAADKAAAEKTAAEKAAADKVVADKAAAEKVAAEKAAADKVAADKAAADKAAAEKAAARKPVVVRPVAGSDRRAEDKERIIRDYLDREKVAKEMADVEFDKAMRRSEELLVTADTETDFDDARRQAQQADDVLQKNAECYTAVELKLKRGQVQLLLDRIAVEYDQWSLVQKQRVATEINQAERLRRQRMDQEKQRKLTTLTKRARSLIRQSRYKLASEEIERIIAIDPENSWALNQQETLANFIITMEERQLDKIAMRQEQKVMVDIRRSEIPWYDLLRYPGDWKELTMRRRPYAVGGATESEADRTVRRRLNMRLPKVDLPNVPLEDVVTYLREMGAVSFYVNWKSLETSNVDRGTLVNIHLVDVSFETVLEKVLKDVSGANVGTPQQIDFVISKGVIEINTQEALAHDTFTRVYDISDLIVSFPQVGMPQSMGLSNYQSGSSSSSSSSSYGSGSSSSMGFGSSSGGTTTGSGQSAQEASREQLLGEIVDLIKTTIQSDWDTEAAISPLRGQLVVTQTAEKHEQVLNLINQLREARAVQIAVEARFITVSTGFLNRIGMDLDLYFNLGSRLGGGGSVTDPVTGATVWLPGASTWTSSGHSVSGTGNNHLTPIGIVQGSNDFTASSTGVFPDIGSNISTNALSIGGSFLDDIQVDFLIQATQAHSLTKTLTAPRITLFNGQAARIVVETQRSYIADLDTEIGTNTSGFDFEVDEVATGTTLYVRGTVSADRRYVTMTLVPQVQEIKAMTWYPFDPSTVISGGGSLTDIEGIGFIQLPEVEVKSLVTTVSVPDGGTLLLGGQQLSGELEREKGVPLLSKIPFVNRLFTNRSMIRDQSSLLILVKPKIIIQREEEEMLR